MQTKLATPKKNDRQIGVTSVKTPRVPGKTELQLFSLEEWHVAKMLSAWINSHLFINH